MKETSSQRFLERSSELSSVEAYFRCPPEFIWNVGSISPLSRDAGFFSCGEGSVFFGRTVAGYCKKSPNQQLCDLAEYVTVQNSHVSLPFDVDELVVNLTQERYTRKNGRPVLLKLASKVVRNSYYAARPMLPLGFRSYLQKLYLSDWQQLTFPKWPVDTTVDDLMRKLLRMAMGAHGCESVPFIWFWPKGANGCAIMTHDVEEEIGRAFCSTLMDINDHYQIHSSFQIVPENRYAVSPEFLSEIRERRFEVNIQDLNHDGRLYWDHDEFKRRAAKINQYAQDWGAVGFRAGILYRNQEWFGELDFEYDMSTPNVAHLDPQRGGCCTVMPFFVGDILELPVTTTQDHSLFHILHSYELSLWKQQMALILGRHGLASFIVHPDYILDEPARHTYHRLLAELSRMREEENIWIALPKEVNRWWRDRNAMTLRNKDGCWIIEGPGSEHATLAFATLQDGELVYTFPSQ